jgi:hypothetical protein
MKTSSSKKITLAENVFLCYSINIDIRKRFPQNTITTKIQYWKGK